jgi:hypothetical protein
MRAILAAAALLAGFPARVMAEDRPSEDQMFGTPAPEEPKPATEKRKSSPPGELPRPSEDAIFGSDQTAEAQQTSAKSSEVLPGQEPESQKAPEDPLRLGGQFYMVGGITSFDRTPVSEWTLSAPTLVDGYFDARPNDRVRGFILARLAYDPTVASTGVQSAIPGLSSQGSTNIALDQLWLRWDAYRSIFLTAGRQHVKWGTARFWNPTDFLHKTARDPLAPFDARLGTTMLKLHVPWEKYGWNFYGIGLLEDPLAGTVSSLGHLGAAARAEVVFGVTEFGLDAIVQRGHKPRFGLDLSSGLGPIDVYAEAAFGKGTATPRWQLRSNPDLQLDPADGFDVNLNKVAEPLVISGYTLSATAGANWSFRYNEDDIATVGAEYFYDSAGYTDTRAYPLLLGLGQFSPSYTGRHHAALYGILASPGSWNNTTFTLSGLGNLTDRSYLVRLDYSVLVLTHLRVEAYGAYHFGSRTGEYRLGIDDAVDINGQTFSISSVDSNFRSRAPIQFELGIGLRINI